MDVSWLVPCWQNSLSYCISGSPRAALGTVQGTVELALSLSHDWAYQPLCLVGQSPGGCSTCGLVWMPADSIMLVGATERATSMFVLIRILTSSAKFHPFLGPLLMITYACLSNTLLLTGALSQYASLDEVH